MKLEPMMRQVECEPCRESKRINAAVDYVNGKPVCGQCRNTQLKSVRKRFRHFNRLRRRSKK